MKQKTFLIILFFIFFPWPFLFTYGGEPGGGEIETETQTIVQYRCSKGACGGTVQFFRRIATRNCQRPEGGSWSCSSWEFSEPELVKDYDTSGKPWLVCTYRYDKLTKEEKERLNIKYPYDKIYCRPPKPGETEQQYCPEVDEVNWFPPVFNGDSKQYFDEKIKNRSFFDVVQVTCWGKCLNKPQGAAYFSGPIDPDQQQNPQKVKLPAKFGWHFKIETYGMAEWEEAVDWGRFKCKKSAISGTCVFPPTLAETEDGARNILKDKWGDAKFKEEFVIELPDGNLIRGMGAGSFWFIFKKSGMPLLERFLKLTEGQNIKTQTTVPTPDPEWQAPGPDIENPEKDIFWTRRDMYDYFDYYFLKNTAYEANRVRGSFNGGGKNNRLFVYSPSQDSKETYLWVEYKDKAQNGLTKQIRGAKDGNGRPCLLDPFSIFDEIIYPCCNNDNTNCYPHPETWQFSTLGPEILSILGIRVENSRKLYPFHLKDIHMDTLSGVTENEGKGRKIEAKVYRFIDIDWDRVWPNKLLRGQNVSGENYFYIGAANFDTFDGGEKNQCQKECWIKCDSKCVGPCKEQCFEECDMAKEKSLKRCSQYYSGRSQAWCVDRVNKNYIDCRLACIKNFEKMSGSVEEMGSPPCPNCKSEEKGLSCIICEKCVKEVEECQEKCVSECEKKAIKGETTLKDHLDCDKACTMLDEDTLFTAINGECNLLPVKPGNLKDQLKKEMCQMCQECKFKIDFVDVETCPIEGYYLGISPFNKERIEDNFPIERFYELKDVKECESITEEPFCEKNPCECYEYVQGEEKIKVKECGTKINEVFLQNLNARNKKEFQTLYCELEPNAKSSCIVFPELQMFDIIYEEDGQKRVMSPRGFVEESTVTFDAYLKLGEFDVGINKVWLPFTLFDEKITPKTSIPWWEQDKPSWFFTSFVPNSVVAFICTGDNPLNASCNGQSIRWDFQINTFPKKQTCDIAEKSCFGELENEYPFCWEIEKKQIDSHLHNFFERPEKFAENEKYGVYRTQVFSLPFERVFSFRLMIKEGNTYLKHLPKTATQSPIRFGQRENGKKFGIEFPISEIWTSLPPPRNALGRLNKEFTFEFRPCGDETGYYCTTTGEIIQPVKVTGLPPSVPFVELSSGPPPPRKIHIPHFFNWDASLGAASYWLLFDGSESHEIFVPSLNYPKEQSKEWVVLSTDGPYTWKVRTCADLCSVKDPNVLQCGPYSEELVFEGYNLFPPNVEEGVLEFLPQEGIKLKWVPVSTQGIDCTHIKVYYKGVGEKEKRKDCIEKAKQNYLVLEKTLKGEVREIEIPPGLLPTSNETLTYKVDNTQFSTNICLGTYVYEIYYCTGDYCEQDPKECSESNRECVLTSGCKERGETRVAFFSIVTKKMPKAAIRGRGFGTCQNLVPCKECHLLDFFKIISNIMNCLLWTISPIACAFLLVYTGIGLYFSFGAPEAVENAKRIWKMVGIGWLIMLFSWTIVNLIGKTFKMPGW
jgi:hypothetical protein